MKTETVIVDPSPMLAPVARLDALAARLLRATATAEELERAAAGLYDLFSSISPAPKSDATALASGLALAPADAATCTRDGARMAAFLRGVGAAIAEARRRFRGERIEVVYAGTGPFAPLIVPLMARLRPEDVRVTFIDIHEEAIRSAARIVGHFGFQRFIRALLAADATTYRHPAHVPLHVIVCETMQRALAVEPQVAIARNLVRQLHRRGIMVPRRVSVELAVTTSPAQPDDALRIGRVAVLDLAAARAPGASRRRVLRIPRVPRGAVAMYTTRLETYAGHHLAANASGLTSPEFVWDLTPLIEGERIAFWHHAGARPAIRWAKAGRIAVASATDGWPAAAPRSASPPPAGPRR